MNEEEIDGERDKKTKRKRMGVWREREERGVLREVYNYIYTTLHPVYTRVLTLHTAHTWSLLAGARCGGVCAHKGNNNCTPKHDTYICTYTTTYHT